MKNIIDVLANELPLLIRPAEVAKLTGLSPKTLANKRCKGEQPHFLKLGRRILYPRQDFITWFESTITAGKIPYDRKNND
ncbi:MAG: helix-turn-helix domain-containing protein [Bacteroidales bacterium]|jgi:predicted DNA-binding transcriptional regulator AlpA|nr:helix-turn-helix domain-containing protein [Bacteroidales bacterium]